MAKTAAEAPPSVSRDELAGPEGLDRNRVRSRLLVLIAIVVVVVLVVTLVPGLASLRDRFEQAKPGWIVAGTVLKLLSGLCYVAVFRAVFCARMSWRMSYRIGMAELGANALVPTGGAGGLALGAWALQRGGVPGTVIARRSVAFFLLTSLPNVAALILVGLLIALHLVPGNASLALTLIPVAAAILAIVATLATGRLAAALRRRATARHGIESRRVKVLGALAEGVSESLRLLREHDFTLLLGLIGYLGFDVMVLWACFHAFGTAPPFAVVWMAYFIGQLGNLLPLPGGIGGVDGGLIGAFAAFGVDLNLAVVSVLAYRLIAFWLPTVPGAFAYLQLRHTVKVWKADTDEHEVPHEQVSRPAPA